MDYDTRDVVSIDMKACYPVSFQDIGEAKPYLERFVHPSHYMTRVAINGTLPRNVGTSFTEVQEWEFEATCHPVIPAWFRRHFADAGWAPTPLLVFLVESGLLKTLKIKEAIFSFGRQTEVWLPDGRDETCSVIGKFTQGSVADGKRLTRRLVIDLGELDFLVHDTRQSGTLVGAPQKCPLGHILTYRIRGNFRCLPIFAVFRGQYDYFPISDKESSLEATSIFAAVTSSFPLLC